MLVTGGLVFVGSDDSVFVEDSAVVGFVESLKSRVGIVPVVALESVPVDPSVVEPDDPVLDTRLILIPSNPKKVRKLSSFLLESTS